MHCTERDYEILMLQHGELSGLRRLLLCRHLVRCPRCQEKRDGYAAVSRHIAGVVRGGDQSAWGADVLPLRARPRTPRPFRAAFVGAALAAAAITAAYVYQAVAPSPLDARGTSVALGGAGNGAAVRGFLAGSAKDAQGNATIFPYSTPRMNENCRR